MAPYLGMFRYPTPGMSCTREGVLYVSNTHVQDYADVPGIGSFRRVGWPW